MGWLNFVNDRIAATAMFVSLAALGADHDFAVAADKTAAPRPLVVVARDALSHRPVDCLNAILLRTRYGAGGDSAGIVRMALPDSGTFTLMLRRLGYRDTTTTFHFGRLSPDSLWFELQRSGQRIPNCSELRPTID